jgi:U1 small nuclear ribonucleoprotein 70kDa
MTDKLPANLLALFQPRPPLRYIPPQDTSPEDRALKKSQISGIADFLPALEEYNRTDEYHPTESWLQRKDRLKAEKRAKLEEMARDDFKEFQPETDPQIRGDAIKTLFVGRLAYEAKESDLEREFGRFGPIERVCQYVLGTQRSRQLRRHALQW